MKKKFIVVLLIGVLIAGIFTLTGCSNNKEDSNNKEENKETSSISEESNNNKITITDKDKKYEITFNSTKFNQKSPAYAQVDSEDLGVFVSFSYNELSKSHYDYYKTHNFLGVEFSEGETKDYTWNNYSGYTYNMDETEANFKILLVDDEENSVVLVGYVRGQSGKDVNVASIFDSEDFQNFLNTIEFKKVTE